MNIGELAKFRGGVSVDTISELTSASGVTIDSVLLKDGNVTALASGTVTTTYVKAADGQGIKIVDDNDVIGISMADGGAVTVGNLSISSGAIISGTFTPTNAVVSGLTSVVFTNRTHYYIRMGAIVFVSGEVEISSHTTGGVFSATLPVSSNLASYTLKGVGIVFQGDGTDDNPVMIVGDASSDKAYFYVQDAGASGRKLIYNYSYQII